MYINSAYIWVENLCDQKYGVQSADRHTHTQTHTDRHTHTQTHRNTHRYIERHTYTHIMTDRKVKTESPKIFSNDIFYLKTVIIGANLCHFKWKRRLHYFMRYSKTTIHFMNIII